MEMIAHFCMPVYISFLDPGCCLNARISSLILSFHPVGLSVQHLTLLMKMSREGRIF